MSSIVFLYASLCVSGFGDSRQRENGPDLGSPDVVPELGG